MMEMKCGRALSYLFDSFRKFHVLVLGGRGREVRPQFEGRFGACDGNGVPQKFSHTA
jgi:hypothetical protein